MRQLITLSLLTLTFLAILVALPSRSYAVNIFPNTICGGAASGSSVCKDSQAGQGTTKNPIVGIISSVIEILAVIIGIASIIGIVISGFRMIASNGDSAGFASARSALIYSLVGVAVASLAQFIVTFVLNNIG